MNYDPYSDPLNPVEKSKKPDTGGTGDFMFGSGRSDPTVNEAEYGVDTGLTCATAAIVNWDKDVDGDSTYLDKELKEGPESV